MCLDTVLYKLTQLWLWIPVLVLTCMHFSVLLEADSVTGMSTSSSTEQVNMGQDDKTLVWYFQSAGLAELCK